MGRAIRDHSPNPQYRIPTMGRSIREKLCVEPVSPWGMQFVAIVVSVGMRSVGSQGVHGFVGDP